MRFSAVVGAGMLCAAGADKGAPGIAHLFGKEYLDATRVAGAVADEAGLKDAGVVED